MRDNYAGQSGKRTRQPKATQQDYLVLSRLSKSLEERVGRYLQVQDATVLDLGCGEKPYQPFFLGKSSTYVGVDIRRNECADVLCDGEALPFDDSVFSACLCLQVLEHVSEPRTVINDLSRVLRPDGVLFLSTHGNWPVHGSPNDYWRWTEHGLRKLLDNFRIDEICKCGGPTSGIIQLLQLFVPRRSLGVLAIFLLNRLGDSLDNMARLNASLPDLATNYLVIAHKRGTKNQ